ncbi:MAG: hypothetical protein Q4P84_09640 [Elusimicrobiales bacterium]|nr:hypothetical protein [Elusimicrobiales bacterium]
MTTVDKSLIGVRRLGFAREIRNTIFEDGVEYACITNGASLTLRMARPSDSTTSTICQAHLGGRNSRAVCVTIPTNLVDAIGWVPGRDYVTLRYGDDNDILLSKATAAEILSYAPATAKPALTSGIVRRGRFLYLTPEQRDLLEIPKDLDARRREGNPFFLKVTYDFVRKSCITIEKMDPGDESLPMLSELMKRCGGSAAFYAAPRVTKFHYTQCMVIPAEFAKRHEFTYATDIVDVRVAGKSLVISGRSPACGFCGHEPDSSKEATTPVYLCRECADVLPAVNRRVKAEGSISAAAKSAQKDLKAALKAIREAARKGV